MLDSLAVGGGAERIAATLGDELQERGYHIHFLTFQDKNPKYKFNGEYHTLNQDENAGNIFKRGFDFLRNSKRIKDLCSEFEFDTLIAVGEVANLHAVLSKSLFANQTHIIISQHINPLIHQNSKLKVEMINFFYNKADMTVCVSFEIEKILKNYFRINNTKTIYNMIDLEENTRLSMEELPQKYKELFNSGFNFINLGSLFKQKGQWFLIRSFKKVVDNHPQAKLFILGEGDLRKKLENLIIELNLESNVFLLGNQENVFPFLKNSSCFVFSSLWEGLPMTLIEALSLNLPIISSDCMTGPREALCPELGIEEQIKYPYYGKYGILNHPFPNELQLQSLEDCPLNEAEEMMADLMTEIIETPSLSEKYTNGREMAKNFDKNKIIEEWEKLLNKKIGKYS